MKICFATSLLLEYKSGCDFKVPFDVVRAKLVNQKPTKELVYRILKENS